ncbi:cysteine synthase family protein [Oceanobacillus caeni]|uniref:O-acetylserine (thiol)-lyase n=1 Tax=Oceanobacillus caeni TaxID=405946 RepID=A0ABR5MM18_9BACI|nr:MULTISPECIES: cysteine synthase family protein [Bacillaceae]KKE80410.1 cysteine synthase [Bacilli bacterium VT-13-104]PZD83408.1 cysteine synthase family protein [Bacilli bacterium]KPH77422.1 cysteine synthase [Oceanobacillus caeni]MBU8790674.1 cysteine synthase family protein [Oceanobacillus caeni]MCR1834699.1 cysteine synthase family protein [Oceanobacillus caeni]
MAVYHAIKELIGETPLLELSHFSLPKGVRLYAKLEFFNPGGSVKDRLGMELIEDAFERGVVTKGGTIIEPTAGNTGIGLALAAKEKGLHIIFCVPEHFSREKQMIMKALGAEIVHTPRDLGMVGAIEKSKQLVHDIPNSYCPQQFANPANPKAYYKTLAPEIWNDLNGKVDIFVAGAGSGGTFMGVSQYLKEKNPDVKTAIVEPEGSIIAGGKPGPHETEGIGMEFLPDYMERSYLNAIHTISDEDAFRMVKELAQKEGLLVGSSSGAAMVAALKEAEQAKEGTNIVIVFPDGSDRYLSKNIYRI